MRDVRGRRLVPPWLAWGTLVYGLVLPAWAPVAAASTAAVAAPIVGGTLTTDFPAVGVVLTGNDPDVATTRCAGTLIGCRTVITAAHCVCSGTGADCQGAGAPAPTGVLAYFDHAGFVPVTAIRVHPDFVFPVADVAVLELATPVTAIAPLRVNDVGSPPFGTAATIVGFGVANATHGDSGLKRTGQVTTAPCVGGISDVTSLCFDYTGAPSANTCAGDSGGPLLVDLGTGPLVAGITSGGFAATCLPTDHSYEANLFVYRGWIESAAGGDLGTTSCGSSPVVGEAGVFASSFAGELGEVRPFALHSIGVAAGAAELRVGLRGTERPGSDFDLYVQHATPPAAESFACRAIGANQYGFCRIANPAPGSWFLRAERVEGEGVFQLVATAIGGGASTCGNGIREPGEACDGNDRGTCSTVCDAECACLECSPADLDVREIVLAPRLFMKATLGDAAGTYTRADPASAGVTLVFADVERTVTIVIPPGDPGWVVANPRRGVYRWRGPRPPGLRRLVLRTQAKSPTEWRVTAAGRQVPGADDIEYGSLLVRVQVGDRCAERQFHVTQTPGLPRAR